MAREFTKEFSLLLKIFGTGAVLGGGAILTGYFVPLTKATVGTLAVVVGVNHLTAREEDGRYSLRGLAINFFSAGVGLALACKACKLLI